MTHTARLRLLGASLFLVLALILIYLLLLRPRSESSGELRSFYLEASVEADNDSVSAEPVADRIKGWYKAPHRRRWEISYSDPASAHRGATLVSDDGRYWFYSAESNTYTVQPLPDDLRSLGAFPSFGFFLGPLSAESLNEFFSTWRGATWETETSATMLDREVDVIKVTGAGGVSQFWIDPQHLFVLRFESDGDRQAVRAMVTRLAYNEDIPDSVFRFEPPAGSREVAAPSQRGSSSGSLSVSPGGADVPPPFLRPRYTPAGFSFAGVGQSTGPSGNTDSFSMRMRTEAGSGGPTIEIEQQVRAGGLSAAHRQGERINVSGGEAYRTTSAGETRLVFAAGEIVVSIVGRGVAAEELLRLAESMR